MANSSFDRFGNALPFLSAADPGYSQEGGLDPLGLYAIADSLAVCLVPGVRERMREPRYLTAIAVSYVVCDGFEPDESASDGKSPPWQVFEWYVVEGLVRQLRDSNLLQGLPGVEKGRTAVRNRVALSASNYLKTAYVFGFHGIYRGLGEALRLYDDAGLLEAGWELVDAWEQDQGLEGFHSDRSSAASWRRSLHDAVRDGLNKAATARSAGWSGWRFFADYLAPRRASVREREVIQRALYGSPEESRHQLLKFLVSGAGQAVWDPEAPSERTLHQAFRPQASSDVQRLLDAISAYEHFARLVSDAFDDCRYALTRAYGRVHPKELAKTAGAVHAAREVNRAYEETIAALEPFGEHTRFADNFHTLTDSSTPEAWVEALLDHHVRNQRRKPPNGKNPWFDKFDDGSIAIRAAYTKDEPAKGGNEYVHEYRAKPLMSFAEDLEMLRS